MKLTSRIEPQPATAQARIGQDLKSMFDNLTAGPMPDRLAVLAMALEEAFERGEVRMEKGPRLN